MIDKTTFYIKILPDNSTESLSDAKANGYYGYMDGDYMWIEHMYHNDREADAELSEMYGEILSIESN